jgi:hypothetical protein
MVPSISLYADDVILFCHPTNDDITAVKEILRVFGQASGLQVNYAKSSATLIRCETDEETNAVELLGCPIVELPISYLGIPLTIHKPTAAQLQPLVERMADKLPTWKTRLMQQPGRLALIKAVLAAIPIHQLLALAPSKKTLKQLERVERGFLWEGRAAANGGSCHVNWRRVARPIALGGLGVQDLERAGMALRLRWQWFNRTDQNRAWHGLDLQCTKEEKDLFFASTTMTVGDGQTAIFWEDRWIHGRSISEIAPELYSCIPKRRRKHRTVADGLQANNWARDIQGVIGVHEIGQYLRIWRLIEHTVLTTEPDRLVWKWNSSGEYTANSAYLATFQGSIQCKAWRMIWKAWAPPGVKFFHWKANIDRCWTAARLARRGLQHHPSCLLCDQMPETIHHLTVGCPFARQIWHEILAWLRMTCNPPTGDDTLFEWWSATRQVTPKAMRKALDSVTLLVPWMVWKHRNACVFDRARPSISNLLHQIKDEVAAWVRAGAKGLRVVVPTTWDVH